MTTTIPHSHFRADAWLAVTPRAGGVARGRAEEHGG